MIRSELTRELQKSLSKRFTDKEDVKLAVDSLIDYFVDALAQGERFEIRGFGSFSPKTRRPRQARNPNTGETVSLGTRRVVHFKPGKELKKGIDSSHIAAL